MKQLCRNKNDNILTTTLCTVLSIKMRLAVDHKSDERTNTLSTFYDPLLCSIKTHT